MLIVTLGLLTVLSVVACGGRLQALASTRVRQVWLVGAALALQIVAISIVPGQVSANLAANATWSVVSHRTALGSGSRSATG